MSIASPIIPKDFHRAIIEVHGKSGLEWLKRLPGLIAECEKRWSLTIGSPFANLYYNYVAPAVNEDGRRLVLKAGVPTRNFRNEMEALRLYNGNGAVRMFEADPELGVMLLERLEPGKALAELTDDVQSASIAASVMRQIWQAAPVDHSFPSVSEWSLGLARIRQQFGGKTGPFPIALFERAESLFAELIAAPIENTLLHGDLHQSNILSAERQSWLVIDPKGVVGERGYEIGPFLLNIADQTQEVLAYLLAMLTDELGLDRKRVQEWCIAQAMLSACWTVEDHGYGWEKTVEYTERIAAIKL